MIDFEDFWQQYPRKQDKKKARAKWARLPNKVKLLIMADIQTRFIGLEKQFIPMPTTYMNGERWEDEKVIRNDGKHGTHRQDSRASAVSGKLKDYAMQGIAEEMDSGLIPEDAGDLLT